MEDIDLRIWEYIDGAGDAEERARVSTLIETDNTWNIRYNAIVQFQQSLIGSLETEQPSMRFDQNIMDAIAQTTIAQPARKYINKWVIRLVVFLFITPITVLLAYYLLNIDWSDSSASYFHLRTVSLDGYMTSGALNVVMMLALVLALVIFDSLLLKGRSEYANKKGVSHVG